MSCLIREIRIKNVAFGIEFNMKKNDYKVVCFIIDKDGVQYFAL